MKKGTIRNEFSIPYHNLYQEKKSTSNIELHKMAIRML